MPGNEQDGYYCTVCGGIPPDRIRIRKIPVDGKETGIDRLDWILLDVASLDLADDEKITDEIVTRVQRFNFIPTKKMAEYRKALLREFRMIGTFEKRQRNPEDGAPA